MDQSKSPVEALYTAPENLVHTTALVNSDSFPIFSDLTVSFSIHILMSIATN